MQCLQFYVVLVPMICLLVFWPQVQAKQCPITKSRYGGFYCTVKTQTGTSYLAGTDDDIYLTLHGISGHSYTISPDDLDSSKDNFENGDLDTFRNIYIRDGDVLPLSAITLRQSGSDGWQVSYVEIECEEAEVFMHFDAYFLLDHGIPQRFSGKNVRTCGIRQQIANGKVSCTNGDAWGSTCTYTCNSADYLLIGPQCVHCQQYGGWDDKRATYCQVRCPAEPPPYIPHGSLVCSNGRNEYSRCTFDCDDGYLFQGSYSRTCLSSGRWRIVSRDYSCEEQCHWKRSHCWPGDCDRTTQLATTCRCRYGFSRTETGGMRCEPNVQPDLSTCRISVWDSTNKDKASPTRRGQWTNCANQQDTGINTQPVKMTFTVKADLNHDLGNRASYVSESKFGVIGAVINVVKIAVHGTETTVQDLQLTSYPQCQRTVSATNPIIGGAMHDCEGNIYLNWLYLRDGDSLCADIKAKGGGYYKLKNYYGFDMGTEIFSSTETSKRICFHYDKTKPAHWTESTQTSSGSSDLLTLTRLTRSPHVRVSVNGWLDPRPPGGEHNTNSASGISRFRLEVHGVDVGNSTLRVQDEARRELTKEWYANEYSYNVGGPYNVDVTLPEENGARLFALILEVHDNAEHVGYARRLLLFDKTSTVELFPSNTLKVVHANPKSGNRWQTDVSKQLCVDWKNRFYNTEMYHNNLLKPVDVDKGREIYRQYDQQSGTLPVSGTNNVLGVTHFEVSWSRDQSPRTDYTNIRDVFSQNTCLGLTLQDGETYDVFVRASDIMGNTKEDVVRVRVDHTGPEVSVWGLRGRWDTDGLYVHNSTDLSTMRLVLTAQDPHSGLATIHWTLGTSLLANDVGERAVGVQRLDNETSCNGQENCYCPSVGDCEIFHYVVTFPNLVDLNTSQGDHHRDYHVTITVTNTATLSTTTTLDLLLDESPPTVGVVWEGLSVDGQAEMDFTSSQSVHARWHGYEDHQSGMRLYRAVLAQRCLTLAEVDCAQNATVVPHPESMASFSFPSQGHYYVSVVGYNGALQPSEVACSDGITYDSTPPAIVNVSMTHARSGHMVGCTQDGKAWLVNSNLTRVALSNVTQCSQVCGGLTSVSDVSHLPVSSPYTLDPQLSSRHCRHLSPVTPLSALVLPSDYVLVTWQARDSESDMEEYYIGMGGDRTTWSAPDLLPFTPTHGHTSYHARHLGLSHGDVFFVFLQAVNKAGLSANLTLGPVLIDVTAPDVTQPLSAVVEGSDIKVSWSDDVFVDPEQPKDVAFTFSFRVGYDNGFVTPFLELPESFLAKCRHDNVTGCARYPLTALYDHDTQQGRAFFFQLHVTNAAGHMTSVNTSSVRLPAHFPPSHAVVMDVVKTTETQVAMTTGPIGTTTMQTLSTLDGKSSSSSELPTSPLTSSVTPSTSPAPATTTTTPVPADTPGPEFEFSKDVDAILQRQEVCATWSGFYHQEEVTIQAGLGTAPDHDDVISFQPVKNASHVCFNVTSAPGYVRLFSVVRATSSGGTAVFSSDGFVMVPHNDSSNMIRVFHGPGCHDNNLLGSHMVVPSTSTTTSLDVRQMLQTPLHQGDFLFVQLSPFVDHVTFTNAILLQTTLTGYQVVAMTPNVTFTVPVSMTTSVSVQVLQCQKDHKLLPLPADHVAVAWEMQGPWQRWVKSVKVETMDASCQQTSVKKSKYSHQQCVLHQATLGGREGELRVHTNNVFNHHTYVTSLQPCFDDGCLPAVTSHPVTFTHPSALTLTFTEASLLDMSESELEVSVNVSVDMGDVETSQIIQTDGCVYKWTVSRDNHAALSLTDWTVQQAHDCSVIQIHAQTNYSGVGKGSLYVCLQLLWPRHEQVPRCNKLVRLQSSVRFQPFHVVELDHATFRETDLEPFLRSQQLGMRLHELFDLDLDFAKSGVMLSAALTNSLGVKIKWFLMTNPRFPVHDDCASDAECVTSKPTDTGYVTFPRHRSRLQSHVTYFVCAVTSQTPGDTVQVCGDGVVIDDTPPVAGVVAVDNADNGFLGYRGHVFVTWSGFSDVETEVAYLPDDVTLNYFVSLGSSPGLEDVAGFVHVGQRTSWSFQHLHVQSGATVYATVRAKDRVGHVTEVSSQLVVVDSTPPSVERVTAGTSTHEEYVSGQELSVHWSGVEDRESGILTIEVGVAREEGGDNVIDFQECDGLSITWTDTSSFVDGHAYVVLLKVTNRAGLTTLQSSEPFVIDSSPPSPGRVWFRSDNTSTPSGYSRQVGVVSVEWAGFTDPHSGLHDYTVGLGSTPQDTDVLPPVNVGTLTSHTWREALYQGKKYYATVQACNRAGLCRVTSSGSITFDNSPPTPGHVIVGLYGQHDKFLGHYTSLPLQWTGFSDPQTGIQHFTWCVGTAPQLCDVTSPAHTLLSSTAHGAGLALPVATPLYVTVRATNPAGLETVSVSDSFQVDTSPPEVTIRPHFLSPRDGQPAVNQWDRSMLHVAWLFRDPESSVVSHTVYVRSQLTGRLVVDPVMLGAENQVMLTLDKDSLLLDGDSHWTSVTACNAAHLCVTDISYVISVDSTPPVAGTFLSPLRWVRETNVSGDVVTSIDVKWRGFSDAESGVALYRLLAGKDYNGQEVSGGRVEVSHDKVNVTQRYSLTVREELRSGELLHLALLAENTLGLASPLVRAEFRCLHDDHNATSGALVLIRHSCQASYCSGECTCQADGKLCEEGSQDCVDLHNSSHPDVAQLSVLPLMGRPHTQQQQNFSTSAKCVEGHWSLRQPDSLVNVSRFQFSFSLANMAPGQGVVDTQTQSVWNDVGRDVTAQYCLPGNKMLQSGQSYVLHVQVWPSRDSHMTFTSPPMMVDHTPPKVRRGKSVIESDATCTKDFDYVSKKDFHVTACWDDVFRDSDSGVVSYQVWMGTSQQGSDHHQVVNLGLSTSWTFPTMHLEHGTRYYVTVRAWNQAGLQTTTVSDGFLIDATSPVLGVVFNTYRHSNAHAQSSTTSISASWHGFEDGHSGVRSYHVAVYDTDNVTHPVMPFTDVGVQTEIGLHNLTLEHTHSYKIAVMAYDAAGLPSPVVMSPAILLDVTPPEGVSCSHFRLQEETTPSLHTPTPSHLHDRYEADLPLVAVESGEVVRVEVMAEGLASSADGFLHLAHLNMPLHFRFQPKGGAIAQHDFLSPDTGALSLRVVLQAPRGAAITARLYRCQATVLSPHHAVTLRQLSPSSLSVCARVRDPQSGVKTMMVGLGTTEGGLQLAPWTAVGHGGHVLFPVHVQQATPLYATVLSQNQAGQWLRFVSQPLTFDTTPPRLDDLKLTLTYDSQGQGNSTVVRAGATWIAEDSETGVESCTCTLDGQSTVQPREQTLGGSGQGQCQWQLRDPRHGSQVKVTVTCVNEVQLQTMETSLPATVLLRPPDASEVILDSLPNNELMSPYQSFAPQVRSNNASLHFFWRGVQDPTVSTVYFRFLSQSTPLTEWSPLHVYKTAAILDRPGRSGEVTAELRAVNERSLTSQVVSASALLDDAKPVLTGQSATATVSGKRVQLDWRHVFRVTRDVTFSLFAGTQRGYGDVINHVTTTATHFEGYSSVLVTSPVYVTIQAVYDNGLSTVYHGQLVV